MEKIKKDRSKVAVLAVIALVCSWAMLGNAGSLNPSAAPGPTMKTLDEVEPRIPISQADIPLTINNSGSYYLTENVNSAGTAITVDDNNVTIDLMGFSLIGPGSGTNYGIYMNARKNVEIHNGTVRSFGSHGIYEASTSDGKEHRAINVRAISNGASGINLMGFGHLVKDCTVAENASHGIYTGDGSTATGNTAYNNVGHGISAGYGCTVAGNTARENQGAGIDAGHGCTVTGNTTYYNQMEGISVGKCCTVIGNTARNNQVTGIEADSGCTITGNAVYGNTDYGIEALEYCLVDQNTAYTNGTNMYTGTGCQVGLNVAP